SNAAGLPGLAASAVVCPPKSAGIITTPDSKRDADSVNAANLLFFILPFPLFGFVPSGGFVPAFGLPFTLNENGYKITSVYNRDRSEVPRGHEGTATYYPDCFSWPYTGRTDKIRSILNVRRSCLRKQYAVTLSLRRRNRRTRRFVMLPSEPI